MKSVRASRQFRVLVASLVVMLVIGACGQATPTQPPTTPPTAPATVAPTTPPTAAPTAAPSPTRPPSTGATMATLDESALVFASFKEPAVAAKPALRQPAIAPDLSNVTVPFILSRAQLERLARDGFVVSPGAEREFFTLYEKARYANVPIFVTSDSLLHVYHLLFDKTLRSAETAHFIPLLRELNAAMLARTDEVYRKLRGTEWEDAAMRSVAFVGVASRLLDPAVAVPDYAAPLVEAELALVNDAAGILPSPIFPGLRYGEDYTQYIPRGHYTQSDALKAYFKSMMWYGRMTFRLKTDDPDVGRAETRSALLLVYALRTATVNGRPALEAWADLYAPTVFFVGRSDDLTVLQYGDVMDEIYGANVAVESLADDARLDAFIAAALKLPPPRILGIVIDITQDVEEATKGMRFMGQRFVPDAYIIRELIFRNVGTLDRRRGLPKGLDIPAAMGSARAYELLDQMGETQYENYPQQMEKMRAWTAGLTVEDWTETLYNTWLYSFYPLMEPPGAGYPAFMQSLAWQDKQLNTVLGSWAELKHDTILYAKQAYAELGAGPPPPPPLPPKGYVEPVPAFYARLAALTAMTREGLEARGLLSEFDAESLQKLEDMARVLQTIAEKELRGEPLTEDEYMYIRFYGGELEHLTMAAADTDAEAPGGTPYMDEEPQAAVIADVATDPDPQLVFEVGVGRINEIHVVVPVIAEDGAVALQVAKGGVFAYYEFPWPMDDRLTDEKWRRMLDEGAAPPPPEWTNSFFVAEGEYSDLGQGVSNFHESLVSALWYLATFDQPGEVYAQLNAQIAALEAQKQYEGRQLMSVHFRSFDRQSEKLAVVTTRETWRDTLHRYEGDYPYNEEPAIAHRGPYTLDVTYTLEKDEYGYWRVTRAVYAGAPPEWIPE